MKRKSQQLDPTIIRSLKKHKTQGNSRRKQLLKDANTHRWSEVIVKSFLQELTQCVYGKVENRTHQELLVSIIGCCSLMAENLSDLMCPQIEQYETFSVVINKEPARVPFDPICGFDKLVTIKNDTKTRDSSLNDSKVKPFGVYQNGKKQIQKTGSSSVSSASKLIPLEVISLNLVQTKSQKENEKQESFLRERIFDNGLPTLNVAEYQKVQIQKTSKLGAEISKQFSTQDYMYDYDGRRTALAIFTKMSTTNSQPATNLLKTTCRVFDNMGLDDKKKYSLLKDRNSTLSNVFDIRRMSKEVIKNPNLKGDGLSQFDMSILRPGYAADNGQTIKNILEASFREKQVICRPIQKQKSSRHSKIL